MPHLMPHDPLEEKYAFPHWVKTRCLRVIIGHFGLLVMVISLAACTSPDAPNSGLRLVSDVTLPPATAILQLQPQAQGATPAPPTLEILSPLQQVTVDANFVLVTPTLPPSKTPTVTPTQSLTPTQTPTATSTLPASATALVLPTSVIIPITREVAAPVQEVCASTWFFIQPRPPSCPLNPPNASQGVYQTFQYGYMVWVSSQDAIYVLYNDAQFPRWEAYRDYFTEGMPEVVGEYLNAPAPGLWQPRRGFGLLWRGNPTIQSRLGWGTMEYEQPYSVNVQISNDGTLFISRPTSGIFALMPGKSAWNFYDGSMPGNSVILPTVMAPAVQPLPIPTMIPVNQ
jgi:hypothetical protein